MDKIVHYSPKISSVILDSRGNKISNIMEGEHRLYAKYSEIPGDLITRLLLQLRIQDFLSIMGLIQMP